MNPQIYMQLADTIGPGQLGDLVELLTHKERIDLLDELERLGCQKLVKPLWYDYELQVFIDRKKQ